MPINIGYSDNFTNIISIIKFINFIGSREFISRKILRLKKFLSND